MHSLRQACDRNRSRRRCRGRVPQPCSRGVVGRGTARHLRQLRHPPRRQRLQPSASSIAFPPAGALEPRRHTLTEAGIVFSLEVADGWSSSGLNCSTFAPAIPRSSRRTASTARRNPFDPSSGASTASQQIRARHTGTARNIRGRAGRWRCRATRADLVTGPEDVTSLSSEARGDQGSRHIECAPNDFFMCTTTALPTLPLATSLGQTNRSDHRRRRLASGSRPRPTRARARSSSRRSRR